MPLIIKFLETGTHTHINIHTDFLTKRITCKKSRCTPGLTKVAMYYCVYGYTEVSRLVVILHADKITNHI